MRKIDLVERIAERHGMSKAESMRIVDEMLGFIEEAVASGEDVTFTGFGTFYLRRCKERTVVNPKTGEKMDVPAKNSVGFKVGKTFKDKANVI